MQRTYVQIAYIRRNLIWHIVHRGKSRKGSFLADVRHSKFSFTALLSLPISFHRPYVFNSSGQQCTEDCRSRRERRFEVIAVVCAHVPRYYFQIANSREHERERVIISPSRHVYTRVCRYVGVILPRYNYSCIVSPAAIEITRYKCARGSKIQRYS